MRKPPRKVKVKTNGEQRPQAKDSTRLQKDWWSDKRTLVVNFICGKKHLNSSRALKWARIKSEPILGWLKRPRKFAHRNARAEDVLLMGYPFYFVGLYMQTMLPLLIKSLSHNHGEMFRMCPIIYISFAFASASNVYQPNATVNDILEKVPPLNICNDYISLSF